MADMAFPLMDLKFPTMRRELIDALDVFSDVEAQGRHLSRSEDFGNGFDGRLATAIHFLFDDTNIEDNPNSHIGFFLFDEAEAKAVHKLAETLDSMLGEPGEHIDSRRLLNHREWGRVVDLSNSALALVSRGGSNRI